MLFASAVSYLVFSLCGPVAFAAPPLKDVDLTKGTDLGPVKIGIVQVSGGLHKCWDLNQNIGVCPATGKYQFQTGYTECVYFFHNPENAAFKLPDIYCGLRRTEAGFVRRAYDDSGNLLEHLPDVLFLERDEQAKQSISAAVKSVALKRKQDQIEQDNSEDQVRKEIKEHKFQTVAGKPLSQQNAMLLDTALKEAKLAKEITDADYQKFMKKVHKELKRHGGSLKKARKDRGTNLATGSGS